MVTITLVTITTVTITNKASTELNPTANLTQYSTVTAHSQIFQLK